MPADPHFHPQCPHLIPPERELPPGYTPDKWAYLPGAFPNVMVYAYYGLSSCGKELGHLGPLGVQNCSQVCVSTVNLSLFL